jgi:aromatic ring-cleaving dioxygenase
MQYHAHVYWQNEDQRRRALTLRQPLTELNCQLGRIWEEAIGPHPFAMYQVNYNSHNSAAVEQLLTEAGLDVLLHEDTGDDVRDHTKGARWLGHRHQLNIEWLREYARNK